MRLDVESKSTVLAIRATIACVCDSLNVENKF